MNQTSQPMIRSLKFRKEREPSWHELEFIVAQAEEKGLRELDADDLAKLPQLHRAALTSLGVARTISADKNLIAYLESLCARAHIVLHSPRQTLGKMLVQGLFTDIPVAVVKLKWHLVLSTVLFALGCVIAYVMVGQEPMLFETFVDPAYAQGRGFDATPEVLREVLFQDFSTKTHELSQFASFLMTHNARIGLFCALLGVACGIPVFYLLLENGFVIGAFAQLHVSKGLGVEFFSWILPHGVPEIGAVLLCGGIGFALAQSVVFPGAHKRFDNLIHRGKEIAPALAGAILMFFFAGLIEGFFRQLVHDMVLRYLMAALMVAVLMLFWSRGRHVLHQQEHAKKAAAGAPRTRGAT